MKRTPIVQIVETCYPSVLTSTLTEEDASDMAAGFAALADPVRLRLLNLLASAQDGEVCACDLVEPIGRSQPTVSHHLKVLTEAGLVTSERRGRWIWYAADSQSLAMLRSALDES